MSESIECLEYLINKKIYNKVFDTISLVGETNFYLVLISLITFFNRKNIKMHNHSRYINIIDPPRNENIRQLNF